MIGLGAKSVHYVTCSVLTLVLFTVGILLVSPANSALAQQQGVDRIALNDKGSVSPQIVITSPSHGTFTTASSVTVTGKVVAMDFANAQISVNEIPVALEQDGTFSTDIALDPGLIFNPILAELRAQDAPTVVRSRIVVIAGSAIADGELAADALGLRFNDSGFDRIASLIKSRVKVDPLKLLPPGPVLKDEICKKVPPFGVKACGEVKVSISQSRPPRFKDYHVELDSQKDAITAAVNIRDIFVSADVEASTGPLSISCRIDVSAETMDVTGAYQLKPDTSHPATINVTQQGDMTVTFGNFNDNTDCNGLLGDVIEGLVNRFIGDIQTRLRSGLEDSLNRVNNAGNTPVAEALEGALADVSIESVINELVADNSLAVKAPLAQVAEDAAGITLSADTLIIPMMDKQSGKCGNSSETLKQLASYHLPAPFPSFGATTPAPSKQPYDIGLSVSVAGLNQLSKVATECGLLHMNLKEIDIGFGTGPINAGLFAIFLPAFSNLDPDLPLTVIVRPTLAPLITGNTGPGGELTELRISQLLMEITDPSDTLLLQISIDVRAGFNLTLDAATKALRPSIGEIADLKLEILDNAVGAELANVRLIVEQLFLLVSSINDSLKPFTLPTIFNYPLEAVEILGQDGYVLLYMKLAPAS